LKKSIMEMLINPYNNNSLHLVNDNCLVDDEGAIIPIVNGIPDFLSLEQPAGLNKKYKRFYDKISRLNDVAEAVYGLFYNLNKLRSDWMKDVEVKPGWNVLETSIGTGWNVKVLPEEGKYFGLDISDGMLKQCRKNSKKWKRDIELFQGNAEYLPFKSETFDSVFHVGGINFFNDRQRAVNEMIRVAKPNTKIVIIDETEKKLIKNYRKIPFVSSYYKKSETDAFRTAAPVDLVPDGMKDIAVKFFDDDKMYQLSFRKP